MIMPPTILGRVATSMGVSDTSNITSDLPEGMLSRCAVQSGESFRPLCWCRAA